MSPAARSRARAPRPEDLPALLASPDLYPGQPKEVVVRESHISWVFLAGDRAYKLKKPLVLPFVDYGTRRRRREMCHEEVRLNRRLADELYLGVRAVAADGATLRLADEDDREAIDYLVEMRRYDERRTLAAELQRGELRREQVLALARTLASFHAQAQPVRGRAAAGPAVERRVEANVHELLAIVEQRAAAERMLALERFVHAFAVANAEMFEARGRSGMVRDVHGDLRAEHVLIDEPIRIVDCVEFDRSLRTLDVCDDLAFLVMDLHRLGGERFARALVRAYREAGGDPGEERLLAFYACHRALVRSKVELLAAAQHPDGAAHGRHAAAARELLALAERFAWQARLPLAIVICGLPAAGKSHLARSFAEVSGLTHLSSDRTRRRLAEMPLDGERPRELHTAELDRMTYAELGRRAAARCAEMGGALVDATFRRRADRDAFAAAFAGAAPLLFVECRAPVELLLRRAARRDRQPAGDSDATLEVVARERSSWEPLDEVAPERHLTVRSDLPDEVIVADVVAALDARIGRGLGGPEEDDAA